MSLASNHMLRQIRDIMVTHEVASERLQLLVDVIAANIQAQVCSIYLRRSDDSMELWATKGLAAKAVHKTRLAPGVGLVGEVVRNLEPLHIKNAQNHRAYSFQP